MGKGNLAMSWITSTRSKEAIECLIGLRNPTCRTTNSEVQLLASDRVSLVTNIDRALRIPIEGRCRTRTAST